MHMWKYLSRLLALPVLVVAVGAGCSSSNGNDHNSAITRPTDPVSTGRLIDPSTADFTQDIGSMPANVIISPDGNFAITTDGGFRQSICSVRVKDGVTVSRVPFDTSRNDRNNGLYYGLAFGSNGRLYAAEGAAHRIAVLTIDADGKLTLSGSIGLRPADFPAGLAADANGRLYVTQNDPVSLQSFGTPASLSVIDLEKAKEIGNYVFKDDLGLSNFPLAIAVNDGGTRVYVGSQRDDAVIVLDAKDPAKIKPVATLGTGSHPIALLLNHDRSRLYVANAQSDTISIVDTASNRITGTILVRPDIAKGLAGATPTGLALSPGETTLYASLGDMDAVAVMDVQRADRPSLDGYLPAGWYPSAVSFAGGRIWVTNAKGNVPHVPHEASENGRLGSPLYIYEGTLLGITPPATAATMQKLSDEALQNARLTPAYIGGENPLQGISRQAGKISHVIYVIKENRTYDQVLGDLPQGNGDPQRCIFGREVTPNLHALAERFVLLDNFYDTGEVSGDGWVWSTQAEANEYVIRNVPYEYSHRGRKFDFEGAVNGYPSGGFPAKGPDGKPLSDDPRFKNGGHAVPDVGEAAGGHLWDMARKQGISYRNYGFFLTDGAYDNDSGDVIIPDNYPAVTGLQPGGRDLDGISDVDFRRFDLSYPDSDAPHVLAEKNNAPDDYLWRTQAYGSHNLPCRFDEWKREFDLMLAKDPSGNAVPNLMTLRLGTDHTQGGRGPSPRAMVADNDYAIGELVDAVSHSPIWKSSAIVVVEDDAQNGPDHVDAHRSPCYVISPWIKKASIDRSFQNTISALRTIECLLNLPPMCQYDAASDVIGDWDKTASNSEPFTAIFPSAAIMGEHGASRGRNDDTSPEQPASRPSTRPAPAANVPLNSVQALAEVSGQMDFTHADRAPADLLNRIIWKTVRGVDSEMPPTPHSVGLSTAPKSRHDDDGD